MLYLPKGLPAADILTSEGYDVAVCNRHPAHALADGTARILLLNLMPEKAVTELDIARVLARTGRDLTLIHMKISGQSYKNTPQCHMDAFYTDFEALQAERFDGLIITGAPVEHLPFEQVRYWPQLCTIFDWADTHVTSTLFICWAAQAGLYHHYGVHKQPLPEKMFGIFSQDVLVFDHPLMNGLFPSFPMPNSRHTEVNAADIIRAGLLLLAQSAESGTGVAATADGRRVFVVGHLEYAAETLHREYLRDKAKGLPIRPPRHYYNETGNPHSGVTCVWQPAARTFYANWVSLL